jgi:hypothetical protein
LIAFDACGNMRIAFMPNKRYPPSRGGPDTAINIATEG